MAGSVSDEGTGKAILSTSCRRPVSFSCSRSATARLRVRPLAVDQVDTFLCIELLVFMLFHTLRVSLFLYKETHDLRQEDCVVILRVRDRGLIQEVRSWKHDS